MSSHRLDDIYAVAGANLKVKDEHVNTPVIHCTDIDTLLDIVMKERGGNDNFELKLGIDGGGGFIKICLNLIDLDEDFDVTTRRKRARYSDGVARQLFKSTSVSETRENMFVLWKMLQVSDCFRTKHPRFATDLKMANILLGLMSHSSCHPCSWCNIRR